MKNVLQELDVVVKDEFVSLPFAISLRKVKSHAKKSMINQQVSLASQLLKNPKSNNAQHVSKLVELDDFDTKQTKVAKRPPLKHLKKTLFSLEAFEEEGNKQVNPIKIHEEDNQTSAKKIVVDFLDQRTRKI